MRWSTQRSTSTREPLLTHNVVEAMRRAARAERSCTRRAVACMGTSAPSRHTRPRAFSYPCRRMARAAGRREALIASYAHMFNMSGVAFRFGNVVGARQTHGVGFDFVRKLKSDPGRLAILGDGSQSKSYVARRRRRSCCSHGRPGAHPARSPLSTSLQATTSRSPRSPSSRSKSSDSTLLRVRFDYAGGDRGIAAATFSSCGSIQARIRSLGWEPASGSRESLRVAMLAMLHELESDLVG